MREKPKDKGRLLPIIGSIENIHEFLAGKTAGDFLCHTLPVSEDRSTKAHILMCSIQYYGAMRTILYTKCNYAYVLKKHPINSEINRYSWETKVNKVQACPK